MINPLFVYLIERLVSWKLTCCELGHWTQAQIWGRHRKTGPALLQERCKEPSRKHHNFQKSSMERTNSQFHNFELHCLLIGQICPSNESLKYLNFDSLSLEKRPTCKLFGLNGAPFELVKATVIRSSHTEAGHRQRGRWVFIAKNFWLKQMLLI